MAGRYRRPTTPEQQQKAAEARQAKLAALHDTLTEQVSAMANSQQWRAWLDVAGKFHQYSFNNTILILKQRPDATQVAGYTLWQQLGRQVDKGEHGIAILAPVTRTVDESADDTTAADKPSAGAPAAAGAEPARRRVVGFRPTYVWDLAQTSGDPLPTRTKPELLTGTAPQGLWESLVAQCEAAGFSVSRRDVTGTANGWTNYVSHEVVVRSDVDDAQAVKTLAHELAHVRLHDPAGFDGDTTRQCRGEREVEAESVAYLVAAEHGLDTSSYSFAYVAHWAEAATPGDAQATVRASATRVLATAHHVLTQAATELDTPLEQAELDQAVVDADELAARINVGVERTNALRHAATVVPDVPAAVEPPPHRLAAANNTAAGFFITRFEDSWAAGVIEGRLGVATIAGRGLGYAPPGWTDLTEHLRGAGFSDAEIIAAGLGTRASTGRVIDRFRDRLMFPIEGRNEQGERQVVGFVGRRNPAHDDTTDTRNPKYLNTGHTPLYTKGEHLYGLVGHETAIHKGGLAVLVEGPMDALAVDVASRGMLTGIAPLGTALTHHQAQQLAAALPAGSDRIVVATDADPAGTVAATRAYELLTSQGLDPRGAVLPDGLDPAETQRTRGDAALLSALTSAEPMARQLVHDALGQRVLIWAEEKMAFAKLAASIIARTPPATWEHEIAAVHDRTGLDTYMLRTALIDRINTSTDADALGRLTGREQRPDLDRGQHIQASPAKLAAMSSARSHDVRLTSGQTRQTTSGAARARRATALRLR